MRRNAGRTLPVLLLAALAWAAGAARADDAARPAFLPTPFGPGYDTLREEPSEPATAGKGLESAVLLAAGHAEVEELQGSKDVDPSTLYAVLLDVRVAPASTTASLDEKSVSLKAGDGAATAPYALCLPGADQPLSLYRGAGMGLSDWNVAIGDRRVRCGGRNIRMASVLRDAALKLTTPPSAAWQGQLLLLFRTIPSAAAELKLGSLPVKIPAPAPAAAAAGH